MNDETGRVRNVRSLTTDPRERLETGVSCAMMIHRVCGYFMRFFHAFLIRHFARCLFSRFIINFCAARIEIF